MGWWGGVGERGRVVGLRCGGLAPFLVATPCGTTQHPVCVPAPHKGKKRRSPVSVCMCVCVKGLKKANNKKKQRQKKIRKKKRVCVKRRTCGKQVDSAQGCTERESESERERERRRREESQREREGVEKENGAFCSKTYNIIIKLRGGGKRRNTKAYFVAIHSKGNGGGDVRGVSSSPVKVRETIPEE